MAVFDLEEQEQISELKTWWRMYGNLVTAVLLVVVLGLVGWQGWSWYQRNRVSQAAAAYAVVQQAAAERDAKRLREAVGELTEKFPSTAYAAMAALTSAKLQFEAGDLKNAKVQLQWVVEKAHEPEFRDLGRLRLAHVLVDEKALEEALELLDEEPLPAFTPRFAELRGDILAALDRKTEARAAYRAALDKLEAGQKVSDSPAQELNYRELLQIKVDSLGDQ